MSVSLSRIVQFCSTERMFTRLLKPNCRHIAENSHTYRTQRDLGLDMLVISGKNLVSEILKVKTQKIDMFTTNFCSSYPRK